MMHLIITRLVQRLPQRPAQAGISIGEYCVIASCVLVVAIGGLALIGQTLNTSWGRFGDSLKKSPVAANPVSQITAAKAGSSSPSAQVDPYARAVSITLQNGETITLPGYPDNLSKAVLTVGANGATDKLLGTLETLARQLLEKGEITEAQASQLFALANTGHDMAAREQIVESLVAQYQSQTTLPQAPVTYQGKTYDDVSRLAMSFDVMTDGTKYESQLALSDAYNTALASGALNDPAVKEVVETLVGQISNLAQHLSEATVACTKAKIAPDEITSTVVSKETNDKSATICTIGDGSDSGVHCQ